MNQLNVSLLHSITTLAAQGWSHRRIACELDINRQTVGRYLRFLESKPATALAGAAAEAEVNPANVLTGSEPVLESKPAILLAGSLAARWPSLCGLLQEVIAPAL